MTKILIVEDQKWPLKFLERAVKKVCPKFISEFTYEVARCYEEAQKMIPSGYDVVLLDHRMPITNSVELEETDFEQYCNSLEGIGYSLIREIRDCNVNTIIVGTSSLSEMELRGQLAPDYVLNKTGERMETDLEKIISERFQL